MMTTVMNFDERMHVSLVLIGITNIQVRVFIKNNNHIVLSDWLATKFILYRVYGGYPMYFLFASSHTKLWKSEFPSFQRDLSELF